MIHRLEASLPPGKAPGTSLAKGWPPSQVGATPRRSPRLPKRAVASRLCAKAAGRRLPRRRFAPVRARGARCRLRRVFPKQKRSNPSNRTPQLRSGTATPTHAGQGAQNGLRLRRRVRRCVRAASLQRQQNRLHRSTQGLSYSQRCASTGSYINVSALRVTRNSRYPLRPGREHYSR